jgi:hydrogenase assembly chaperone HypC/HupF
MGIPMKVISLSPGYALCERGDDPTAAPVSIDMKLVGEHPVGTWVLTFLDSAREVLSEEKANDITNALKAVSQTLYGDGDIDHLFADLVNREPQLPDHLKPSAPTKDK